MSILTINNNNNNNKVLNNNYNLYVPFTCVDSGWENGTTGGTGTCEGYIEFTFADLLGIQNGFIRFISNGDNGQYGTYSTNSNSIIINQNIDITELFRTTLFAQCSATYPCTPTIYNTVYNIEYSNNGLNNWQQFNLNVG